MLCVVPSRWLGHNTQQLRIVTPQADDTRRTRRRLLHNVGTLAPRLATLCLPCSCGGSRTTHTTTHRGSLRHTTTHSGSLRTCSGTVLVWAGVSNSPATARRCYRLVFVYLFCGGFPPRLGGFVAAARRQARGHPPSPVHSALRGPPPRYALPPSLCSGERLRATRAFVCCSCGGFGFPVAATVFFTPAPDAPASFTATGTPPLHPPRDQRCATTLRRSARWCLCPRPPRERHYVPAFHSSGGFLCTSTGNVFRFCGGFPRFPS